VRPDTNQGVGLVLAGGTVIDPASGVEEIADVAVVDGRVDAVGHGPANGAAELVDCTGQFVIPALVDAHTHVFPHATTVGAPPDEAHLGRGVLAVADAGTSGASTFEGFLRFVVLPAQVAIRCFLNVSALGVVEPRLGELVNPDALFVDEAIAKAVQYPDVIVGFKIRLSHDVVLDRTLELLDTALSLAERAHLPLMVHIGETDVALPRILERLRPSDIVAHCYTGKANGILGPEGVLAEVWEARARGVLFDSAHGKSNLSFAVARRALSEGFLPDVITSDTSARNWRGPVFDLVTTMSKFAGLGVELADIVERTTLAPATLLGLRSEGYGELRVGGPAHVTVLKREEQESELTDAEGNSVRVRRLEPTLILCAGSRIPVTPWRGFNS